MTDQETFGQLCRRVCAEEGWELLPSGVQVHFADGRRQLVSLEVIEEEQEEIVRLHTTIGSASQLDIVRLESALRVNFNLLHGALALSGDELVMIDTLLLRDADADELRTSLGYLAETADYYEKILFHTDEH